MRAEHQTVTTGNARAVVLLGEKSALVPATLAVHAAVADAGCKFLRPCPLARNVRTHVSTFLVPVAHSLMRARGRPVGGFRLSFSLPAAAHLHDEQIKVEGHSADLAIVLAMVSAALGEPLSAHVAATGQIVDEKGRVGMVRGIAEKLQLRDSTITTMLVPDWKNDALFERLYPQEYVSVRTAIKGSSRRIEVVSDAVNAFEQAKLAVCGVQGGAPKTDERYQTLSHGFQTASTVRADDRARARNLITQCSEFALRETIDRPIDEKFATFRPETTVVDTSPEMLAVVERLLRHLGIAADNDLFRSMEAERLISTTFATVGGTMGALRMIRHGRDGGLREVLNRTVGQLKDERRQLFVRGALAGVIDPADGEDRLRLIQALVAENRALLPPETELSTAEELAHSTERLVMTISAAASQVTRVFSP